VGRESTGAPARRAGHAVGLSAPAWPNSALRLLIVAVGRLKSGPHLDLQRFYAERLTAALDIREVEERRKLPGSARQASEGELLLAALPERAFAVALDERGKSLPSADFAKQIAQWQQAAPTIAFLIGGADGHSAAVRARADYLLALGPMTWPHLMVRAMLCEQLYRAQQILAGHPYHRE
jgi:23S rRNA (pseudouridine1915-N3)-methyltransferase